MDRLVRLTSFLLLLLCITRCYAANGDNHNYPIQWTSSIKLKSLQEIPMLLLRLALVNKLRLKINKMRQFNFIKTRDRITTGFLAISPSY